MTWTSSRGQVRGISGAGAITNRATYAPHMTVGALKLDMHVRRGTGKTKV